jgi:hypothetical protein
MSQRTPTAHLKTAFLRAFATYGNVSRACDESGAARRRVYEWKEHDPRFLAAFQFARVEAVERLENVAYERAVEGYDKPVYQGGERVGTIREYSDSLLTLLLKANAPEKYRERSSIEHTGKDGGPIAYRPDLTRLSHEELDALERLLTKSTPHSG